MSMNFCSDGCSDSFKELVEAMNDKELAKKFEPVKKKTDKAHDAREDVVYNMIQKIETHDIVGAIGLFPALIAADNDWDTELEIWSVYYDETKAREKKKNKKSAANGATV